MDARTQDILARLGAAAKPKHPTPTGRRIGLIGVPRGSGALTFQVMELRTDGRWYAQPAMEWTPQLERTVDRVVASMRGLGEVVTADRADRSITDGHRFAERRDYHDVTLPMPTTKRHGPDHWIGRVPGV